VLPDEYGLNHASPKNAAGARCLFYRLHSYLFMKIQTLKKLAVLSFFALSAFDLQADIPTLNPKARDTISLVNNMETKNGFSAQFWMTTDEHIFSTWARPGAIRNLKPITFVKRNMPVYLALFISSPGISKVVVQGGVLNNSSDVTFDLYIIGPQGTLSLAYLQKIAWKGTSPSPGLVYLAHDRGTLNFEMIDTLGEYTIVVILHDNVRNTDLKLTRKLELVE